MGGKAYIPLHPRRTMLDNHHIISHVERKAKQKAQRFTTMEVTDMFYLQHCYLRQCFWGSIQRRRMVRRKEKGKETDRES